MPRSIALLLLGTGLAIASSSAQQSAHAPLRIFLNEVQPGAMSAPQYCTIVFDDHRFHSEKADLKIGRTADRKVYEGQLSDKDWSALIAIIDSKEFSELKVPRTVPPLVMQDSHPYTISVARDKEFQNMEFLDAKSMKPYEAQVKPLLQWWKGVRGRRVPESSAPAEPQCALDSAHSVFAQ